MDWYKTYKDFWSNPKVKIIEKMPDADTIIVIWHKILTHLCQYESVDGALMLGGVPLTEEMIQMIVDRQPSTVRLAIKTFQSFGMVVIDDEKRVIVKNWAIYQSTAKMLEKRVSNRERQARFYEKSKQKLLSPPKPNALETRYTHVTNATEVEVEVEVEVEKDLKIKKHAKKSGVFFNLNIYKPEKHCEIQAIKGVYELIVEYWKPELRGDLSLDSKFSTPATFEKIANEAGIGQSFIDDLEKSIYAYTCTPQWENGRISNLGVWFKTWENYLAKYKLETATFNRLRKIEKGRVWEKIKKEVAKRGE